MKKVLYFFGTGKLTFKIVEGVDSDTIIVIFTTEKQSQNKRNILYYNDTVCNYDYRYVKYISDTESVNEQMNFTDVGINIYIMNVYSHIELINKLGDFYAISCCREGLIETYLPLLNSISAHGVILSFDNDKSIAQRARSMYHFGSVYAGVAHCYVPFKLKFDQDNQSATLVAERYGYLFFPKECCKFKTFIKARFDSPISASYSKSEKDFKLAVQKKLLNVNVLHTLICMEVKLLYPREYDSLSFGDINFETFSKIKNYVLYIHDKMYVLLFGTKDDVEDYAMSKVCASDFLDNLRKYNERCTRGIDFNSTISRIKLSEHIEFIKSSGVDISRYASIINSLPKCK